MMMMVHIYYVFVNKEQSSDILFHTLWQLEGSTGQIMPLGTHIKTIHNMGQECLWLHGRQWWLSVYVVTCSFL